VTARFPYCDRLVIGRRYCCAMLPSEIQVPGVNPEGLTAVSAGMPMLSRNCGRSLGTPPGHNFVTKKSMGFNSRRRRPPANG
jgi:hypothetical protein